MDRPRDAIDSIVFKTPCAVPWATMRGDDLVRRCDACCRDVYNIEALTRAEARRLIANREGRLCVRLFRRPDGTVATADCWSRLRAARRRGLVVWLAALVVVLWAELVAVRFGLTMVVGLMTRLAVPVAGSTNPAPAPAPVPRMPPRPPEAWGDFAGGI